MTTAALDSLSPIQRLRRARRLLREIQGQRALELSPSLGSRDRNFASERITAASAAALAELIILEETGVLEAIDECFLMFFGSSTTRSQSST